MIARRVSLLAAAFLLAAPALFAQRGGARPIRIVLLVDSSAGVSEMMTQFRAGLNAFLDELPGDPEIAFISTGGQIRIRVPPTTDRAKLHMAASAFTSDGGGNTLLETMIEADKRFLQKGDDLRPVFVILMADASGWRGDQRVDLYNRWLSDFLDRGGRAHGIVVRGVNTSINTDILMNITSNSGGYFDSLSIANTLAERMKTMAIWVAVDMP